MKTTRVALICLSALLGACTMPHSKQALLVDPSTPTERARFVTEEDSGVALFGILTFSEPDHYAVLLERARRTHRCARLHHAQLDYYTDHWIVLAFPLAMFLSRFGVELIQKPSWPSRVLLAALAFLAPAGAAVALARAWIRRRESPGAPLAFIAALPTLAVTLTERPPSRP